MQSPGFVLALIFLFFLLGLNLFGVFELGTSLVGLDAKATAISAAWLPRSATARWRPWPRRPAPRRSWVRRSVLPRSNRRSSRC
jgi:hypothetical protein